MQQTIFIDTQDFISISQGNKDAFERLFKKYYRPLCEYARSVLGDSELSEDVVQEVFIYFWNNRHTINIHLSVKSYLYTAVRHGALNILKKQLIERRHSPQLTEFVEFLQTSDYSEEEQTEINHIRSVMEELPKQCLKVFLMSALEEKKYNEIAEELGISVNTVKTHITKAYRLIRGKISSDMRLVLLVLSAKSLSDLQQTHTTTDQ